MYARPNTTETEEDILKLQEEFLNQKACNKIKSAATVVKEHTCEKEKESPQSLPIDPQEELANTFESIPTNIRLGNVVQNLPQYGGPNFPMTGSFPKTGFPQAKRRDPSLSTSKGSIFSQHIKRLKKDTPVTDSAMESLKIVERRHHNCEPMDINDSINKQVAPDARNVPLQSYIVTGDAKEDIHKENVGILEQMSEAEIMEERERLLSTMDPAIVAFLVGKRKEIVENRTPSIAEQNKAAECVQVTDVEASREIVMHKDADKWLNFDSIETGKLAWMTEINIPKYKRGEQYEARFDFAGWLLPFTEPQINEKNRTLYHHGDEPGRPGYTLQELFQLCRSNVNQQKNIALNTIANILSLYQSGVYDNIIDLPFEQIFFVLRFCLDDNTPAILNASIKAVRNLFFYAIDEMCLDNLLGFGLGMVQPILAVDNSETEDDNTINDQQLAEANLVRCLIRTNILKRIQYVINTVKPSMETIIYCLEILIRLVRDSNFVAGEVFKSEDLLMGIAKNFLPLNFQLCSGPNLSTYGCPLVQALKLFRVLAARSKHYSVVLINRYKIMDSIAAYLSSEALSVNSNGLKLQIECLHLFCTFMCYSLAINYFRDLEPVLLRMLDYHVRNTNAEASTAYILHGHTAALLSLLTEAFKQDGLNMNGYLPLLVELGEPKWTSQFCSLKEFSCGKLQIITACIRCLTYYCKRDRERNAPVETVILNLLNSAGFQAVTGNIITGSNFLNNYTTHTSSANLKSIESVAWNAADHIIPNIQIRSCLPFLNILSEFICNSSSNEMKLSFLKHPNLVKYLKAINSARDYSLITNWFTRLESELIVNILRMAVAVQDNLDTSLFYEIAVKCLSVFNIEQKRDIQFILMQIVFSVRFYPCETLINNLVISGENQLLKGALDNLENIFQVYSRVLNIKSEEQLETFSVEANIGSVMPVDWIYSPIVLLYSNQQQNKSGIAEEEQIFIITNCLRWIYIYEMYFPRLAKFINATDRFCRIACTFLSSDSLFLNPEIHNLLENCLKNILSSNENDINFHKSIHGLNNFQDFYTQLLEQYQGVSYGDTLFGNFILLPLMQRHDVKYRKLLWSEYAGIVQIFNVTQEQVSCPTELFLNPPETDVSLLKCYRKAIVTGAVRRHSFLYEIAQHHVESFIKRRSQN